MATRIHYGQILSISIAMILLIDPCVRGTASCVRLPPMAPAGARKTEAQDRAAVSRSVTGNSLSKQATSERLGDPPLWFEPNRGQANPKVKFFSQGKGYGLFITQTDTILSLYQTGNQTAPLGSVARDCGPQASQVGSGRSQPAASGASMSIRFAGANHNSRIEGLSELSGKVNYFTGDDPSRWRTGIPTYARVRRTQVYRGIDVLYYGNKQSLEYDFIVRPGASPDSIKLDFDGIQTERLDAEGNLVLSTSAGDITQKKPAAYQEVDGVRTEVAGRYVIKGKHRAGITVGTYDRSRELVIDPPLAFSTFIGSDSSHVDGIAVDSSGSVYATGLTAAAGFPVTTGSFQSPPGQVFVMKLSPDGGSLVYSSRFGSGLPYCIALDSDDSAYIVGSTNSASFPTTPGAFRSRPANGNILAFVTKLNSTGSALAYSTLLGEDDGVQGANAIAVDSQGSAYVTGNTSSSRFPTTPGSFQPAKAQARPSDFPIGGAAGYNAFVTKLNAAGSSLVYSTFLGGDGYRDAGNSIAVDSAGNAYVAGQTDSTNFPVTPGAFQTAKNTLSIDSTVAFVSKLNSTGSGLVYSTLLGGDGGDTGDSAASIAIDQGGSAYVTGKVESDDFPTLNAVQPASTVAAMLRTADGAATTGPIDNGLPSSFQVAQIVVDPSTPTTVYAGGSVARRNAPAIYKSTNRGASWTAIAAGLPANSPQISGLAIDPRTPSTLYLSLLEPEPIGPDGAYGNLVYKSTNGGVSWTRQPVSIQANSNKTPLVVDPHNPSTVYFFSQNSSDSTSPLIVGPYKSIDAGNSWNLITTGLTSLDCRSMAINPQDSSIVYLATRAGIFKSTNGGLNWSQTAISDSAYALAVDPLNPQIIYAATVHTATASGLGRGNPRSRKGQGDPTGLIKSQDGGVNWSEINSGLSQAYGVGGTIAIDPENTQTLYVGTGNGSYKSIDGGNNWQQSASYAIETRAIAIDPSNSSTVYFNGQGKGLAPTGFVTRINTAGTALVYSSYLGGIGSANGSSIAVDALGNAYVAGVTDSLSFPVSGDAPQRQNAGLTDVFVVRLNPSGSLGFSTYLGGSGFDSIAGNTPGDGSRSLAVDTSGNMYVGGWTQSEDFPTVRAFQAGLNGPSGVADEASLNGFITKLGSGSSGSTSPDLQITSVSAIGKKLFVSGRGFKQQSVVLIDGQPQATIYDPSSGGTSLTVRKGGKRIGSGQTVSLQVQNPDGMSNQYSFTRP